MFFLWFSLFGISFIIVCIVHESEYQNLISACESRSFDVAKISIKSILKHLDINTLIINDAVTQANKMVIHTLLNDFTIDR